MLKIYKASAGSGKTYTLAYEYIRTLLGVKKGKSGTYRLNHKEYAPDGFRMSNRHRHILAITFTNKATEEMKRRIIKELYSLSVIPVPGAKDAEYSRRLCDEFGCNRRQLAQSAAKALEELLDTYSDFNVTTIDSFFQRVLRTFARELDRQGDFAIEINDHTALQMTVNTMLDDFNRNPEEAPALGKWLIDFMMRSVDEGSKANFLNRSSSLYSRLIGLATQICDEKFKPYSEDMRKYLGMGEGDASTQPEQLTAIVSKLRGICARIPNDIAKRIDAMWRDFDADGITPEMLAGRKTATRLLTQTFPARKVPAMTDLTNKTVVETINGESMPFTKSRFKGNDTHVERVREELRNAVDTYYRYYDYLTLLKALPQLSLLAYAWRYLDKIIADNNTVLLSDTNHLLQRIIGADETPFIYERMGVNLTNFLIDEFQDTSKMQWQNLRPLMAESLARDHDNLIIGDEKQSIYRFRNSDSSLLHTQVADVDFPAVAGYNTRVEGDKPGQNTNWRSAADVVRFNNTLFTLLASEYGVAGYDNVIQQIAPKNADLPGYVRFITPNIPDDGADTSEDDYAEVPDIIDIMADDMRRQHSEGGYRWSDIAVLVNRNVEGAKVIAGLSARHPDIPVVSSDSMLLRKSTAVMMVLSIMRIYAQSHSNTKVTESKGNIYPDMSQTAAIISRYKYLRQQGLPAYDAIVSASDTSVADSSPAEVVRRIVRRRPSSLVSLIETIILEFVSERDRTDQAAYLAALEDFAIEWSDKYPPSVIGFLDAWESKKDKLSVTSASDIDAVTVITIHKSKGLEYDCVHIPFGSWRESKGVYSLWLPFPVISGLAESECPPAVFVELSSKNNHPASIFHDVYRTNLREELTDTLNKTYVAYTRAGRELTVYYDPAKDIGKTIKSVFDRGADLAHNPCLMSLPDAATYDDSTGNLTIGAPTKRRTPENESDDEPDKSESKSLGSYNVTLNDSADVYTRVDDMLDDSPEPGDTAGVSYGYSAEDFIDEKSRLRGIALHDIVSHVITVGDAEDAVRNHTMRHDLCEEEEARLLTDINAMLSSGHPKLSQWFAGDADVLTEQSIYSPDTGETIRLDRIVCYPDGSVDIIDYKFTTAHRAAHRRQVSYYIGQLRSMGYADVRGYLWYPLISNDDIIEVKQ